MPVKKTEKSASRGRKPASRKPAAVRKPAPAKRPLAKAGPKPEALKLAERICQIANDSKGINPVIVDLRKMSGVADFFVVVSGNSLPHLRAIFEDVAGTLKKEGTIPYRKTEHFDSGWVVLDYVDVVMHVLLEEMRTYYSIEDLWSRAR